MTEKGASQLDKGAHRLMAFWAQRYHSYEEGRYSAFYHEEGLYSVYDWHKYKVTLVFACNPDDAIEKARAN